ncbi:cysteine proteinase [Lindgomyces ingoldianus]|uniref:Cysteine proteinase n=1 Tax=Lindgomyces ingoldianus TaxID=673940 RepID=A0ACB6Q9V0_9PLEO|nr:cysteine proteinase [Lindgomyces ingoldianus]KAF2463696.1 cysteine proteinase [Lindgomyces ingoldianus]
MNGVSRFLSRRDKHHEKRGSKHARSKSRPVVPSDLYTIFSNEELKLTEKDDEKKIKMLVQRLHAAGITRLGDAQAEYALSRYPNDLDQAYDMLVLANDSFEGILKDFNPNVKMLGAENRNMVTCYLDALLFAMFARLDSFEAMLFDTFNDEPRKKLAAVLRLWVNLLRAGRLITTDLTKHLQEALGNCGWEEATQLCQQDASEAFTFITGALELPLLTLKMDIYHTGREDKEDDHKFVNERLLEVAIPEQEGDKTVTLEDCLETYFNNRIEVKRYLQRQNTVGSFRSFDRDADKGQILHIEAVEVSSAPNSPTVSSPVALTPISPIRPLDGRRRADSIFSERYTPHGEPSEKKRFDEKRLLDEMLNNSSAGRPRSASLRKEVMMPAWQFFSLIPWYTDNVPKTDAQVAAHFSAKRPVLGICLKRYMMLTNGSPKRLDTYIDIPLEIGLPHFISDDRMDEVGPLFGNFKLVLQSIVCHRGVSVDSGHYISLVRANGSPSNPVRPGSSSSQSVEVTDSWLRFDDLAKERVTEVDIKEALKSESPYLLFFQVQPIDEELASRGDPPSYAEAQSGLPSVDPSKETLASTDATTTDAETTETGDWEKVGSTDLLHIESANSEEPIGRSSMSSNHRSSVAFEELEGSMHSGSRGRTAPTTPAEEKAGFLLTSRRNSKNWMGGGTKSRPSSQAGESRLSLTITRLTGRGSKDKLQVSDGGGADDPVIVINEVESKEGSDGNESPVKEKHEKYAGRNVASGRIGRSKSKRDKGKEKIRLRSKSREPRDVGGNHEKEKGKHKEKSRPDRECLVM